jgi:hypothetical protein
MAVNLSPVGGAAAQFFDNSGNVLTGGKLYTYLAGTTTPAVTYTTNSGITAHSNPIVLNAAGRVPDSGEIWLTDGILYKFVLKDANDVQIATWDNIDGINSNFIAYTTQNEIITATQGQTIFTLTGMNYQPATNSLAVYVNGSKQILTLNYIETSSTVVTFVDGLNVGDVVQFTTASAVATNVVDASNVSYNEGDTGAIDQNVQDRLRQYISVKDFGAVGDNVTNDTIAIQDALTVGGTIYVPAGTYKCGELNVTVANTTLICAENAIFSFPVLGSDKHGFTVTVNNFTIQGGKLIGPGYAADVGNEAGIWMKGTDTNTRLEGITLQNVEFTAFGSYCVYRQFVNNIRMVDCYIYDTRAHGAVSLSCNDIIETGNIVDNVTLNSGSSAWGLMHTHDSTGYPSAANPFCINVYCAGNTIKNIGWEGIDSHGAYGFTIVNNKTYNTKLGISAGSSSGAALNYAGYENIVMGNTLTSYKEDGSIGDYMNIGYGININGGSVVYNEKIVCSNNILVGKGETSANGGGAIRAAYCTNVVISDNIIDDWAGHCIYLVNTTGIIANNQFGGLHSAADTQGQCIKIDGTTARTTIANNKHWYGALNQANEGLRINSSNLYRQVLAGNDFSEATTPYAVTGLQVLGTDILPVLDVSGSGTSVDVAELDGWDGMVTLSANATHNVDTIANIQEGQSIRFTKTGTGTVTFVRTGSPGFYLDGGTNKTLSGKYNLTIQKLNTFLEQVSYSANS